MFSQLSSKGVYRKKPKMRTFIFYTLATNPPRLRYFSGVPFFVYLAVH